MPLSPEREAIEASSSKEDEGASPLDQLANSKANQPVDVSSAVAEPMSPNQALPKLLHTDSSTITEPSTPTQQAIAQPDAMEVAAPSPIVMPQAGLPDEQPSTDHVVENKITDTLNTPMIKEAGHQETPSISLSKHEVPVESPSSPLSVTSSTLDEELKS